MCEGCICAHTNTSQDKSRTKTKRSVASRHRIMVAIGGCASECCPFELEKVAWADLLWILDLTAEFIPAVWVRVCVGVHASARASGDELGEGLCKVRAPMQRDAYVRGGVALTCLLGEAGWARTAFLHSVALRRRGAKPPLPRHSIPATIA